MVERDVGSSVGRDEGDWDTNGSRNREVVGNFVESLALEREWDGGYHSPMLVERDVGSSVGRDEGDGGSYDQVGRMRARKGEAPS